MTTETKPEISFEEFMKLDLRTGTVLSFELVPKSKKLLKLEVDFGPVGKRTIMAGIASMGDRFVIGQKVIAVLNLAPRQLMGITSHGMLLATHDAEDKIWLLTPGGPVEDGVEVG